MHESFDGECWDGYRCYDVEDEQEDEYMAWCRIPSKPDTLETGANNTSGEEDPEPGPSNY